MLEEYETFRCLCYGDMLVVTPDKEDGTFDLAIFSYKGYAGLKHSFLQRIKWVWCILIKGTVWNDEIILGEEEAKKLSEYLTEGLK